MRRRHILVAAILALGAATARADAPLALTPPLAPAPLEQAQGADDTGGGRSLLMGALYGGAAGALVGLGIALIENDHYARDVGIGAGAGILVGAAFGAARAFGDHRPLSDGLGTLDRTPVIHGTRVATVGLRF